MTIRVLYRVIRALKPFNYSFPFFQRSLRAYRHRIQSMLPIIFSYMFRMLNINRINYAFLVWRIAQYGITKSFDTWLHIQLLAHFF